MKKLLTALFVFALLSAYTFGQTKTCVFKVLSAGVTYYEYTPIAAQYIGGHKLANGTRGYDTLYFEVVPNKNVPTNCNARIEVVRVGSTDTYDMDVQAKLFANGTYAALTESAANVTHKELLDTTRIFGGVKHVRADKYFRYFRVIVNDDNACAVTDSLRITKVIFKFYER